jgi:hypothetical protein
MMSHVCHWACALQVHTFYEAVGLMIGAESEAVKRDEYLVGGVGAGLAWARCLHQLRVVTSSSAVSAAMSPVLLSRLSHPAYLTN